MNGNRHPFETFIEATTTKLRTDAGKVRVYGPSGENIAAVLAQTATILETDFAAWWLTMLTVSEAAPECGYSEEGLRGMCRKNEIPHSKGDGENGHIRIARCHLPHKPGQVESEALSLADVRAKKLLGDRAA